jgi:hypothetical protein
VCYPLILFKQHLNTESIDNNYINVLFRVDVHIGNIFKVLILTIITNRYNCLKMFVESYHRCSIFLFQQVGYCTRQISF